MVGRAPGSLDKRAPSPVRELQKTEGAEVTGAPAPSSGREDVVRNIRGFRPHADSPGTALQEVVSFAERSTHSKGADLLRTLLERSPQSSTPNPPEGRAGSSDARGGKSKVALGKQRDLSAPPENLNEIASERKRELLKDAQVNIWKGHLKSGEVADLMIKGEVVSSETLHDGTSKPEKITLDSGIVGVFKPYRESPTHPPEHDRWFSSKLEIVAFQIDEKLKLGMVPLTVEREIHGEKGSFQLWVNDLNSSPSDEPPNNARFFDFLIHHEDRFDHEGGKGLNIGYNPDRALVLYDNTIAFSPLDGHFLHPKDISKLVPHPAIYSNALKLNMRELDDVKYLTPKRKVALLQRRDLLTQLVMQHIRSQGKRVAARTDQ